MIDQKLLQMLVCPETGQPLLPADPALVARLNKAVAAGTLKSRNGLAVEREMAAGLVREDGRVLYPVVDGIPVMLADEAIDLEAAP